ncbi:MAG: PQQ-binding-like beta-propeller repeat protein [Aeromicrobium sp.]
MRTIGGIMAMLLALTACTGGDGGSDSKAAEKKPSTSATPQGPQRDTRPATVAWTTDLDVIGQPLVTGTTAVVIARASGKRLEIVGVDTTTGLKRWSHPYSPGGGAPGILVEPVVSSTASGEARVVFYLAPDKPKGDDTDFVTPVVSVDPVTGDIERRTDKLLGVEPVGSCDDGTDVCVRGAVGGRGAYGNLRVDLGAGKVATTRDGAPDKARIIGTGGLFSTNARPGEKLGVRLEGTTLWSTPAATLFGEGYTSDNGWVFVHEKGPDRFTGLIGQPNKTVSPTRETKGPFVYDLAKQKIVSFSGKDGSVLWARDGADPCFKPTDFSDEADLDVVEHPVRCLVSGSYSIKDEVVTTDAVTMKVEGYDPATGETTWSHAMPDAAAATYWQQGPRPLVRGGKTIVAPLEDGPSSIDVATGASTPVGDDVFLCQAQGPRFEYVTPWTNGQKRTTTRRGTGFVAPCSADGSATSMAPTVAAVREGAVAVDDSTYVLSSKDGLVGYTVD